MGFGRKGAEAFSVLPISGRVLPLQQVSTESACWGLSQGGQSSAVSVNPELQRGTASFGGLSFLAKQAELSSCSLCSEPADHSPALLAPTGSRGVPVAPGAELFVLLLPLFANTDGTISAWLSLCLLPYQCRCAKAASFWTLVRNTLPSELNFSWFTALPDFWLPSCLPGRKGTHLWSHLLPLKPQCYRKETSPNGSSIPEPRSCTEQLQRLILFVKLSVAKKQNVLSDVLKK